MAKSTTKKTLPRMGINLSMDQRPFVEALILSNDGEDLCDASEELKTLVKAVREHGVKGHVTVKIAVSGLGKKEVLTVSVTSKIPKPARNRTAVFADENGNLMLSDPDQYELDFAEEEESTAA